MRNGALKISGDEFYESAGGAPPGPIVRAKKREGSIVYSSVSVLLKEFLSNQTRSMAAGLLPA